MVRRQQLLAVSCLEVSNGESLMHFKEGFGRALFCTPQQK